jgi:hypothetical protein
MRLILKEIWVKGAITNDMVEKIQQKIRSKTELVF